MVKTCTVDDCNKSAEKVGLCSMHYRRKMVHGSVHALKHRSPGTGYFENGYAGKQIDGVKKFDHVRIAEEVLGRPLPPGAVVHHMDGDRLNNTKSNLAILPSRAYHNMIHARMRSMDATGRPDMRKCTYCGKWDEAHNVKPYKTAIHAECARIRATERR